MRSLTGTNPPLPGREAGACEELASQLGPDGLRAEDERPRLAVVQAIRSLALNHTPNRERMRATGVIEPLVAVLSQRSLAGGRGLAAAAQVRAGARLPTTEDQPAQGLFQPLDCLDDLLPTTPPSCPAPRAGGVPAGGGGAQGFPRVLCVLRTVSRRSGGVTDSERAPPPGRRCGTCAATTMPTAPPSSMLVRPLPDPQPR